MDLPIPIPIPTFCFNGFRCDVTKMEDVVSLYDEAEEHFKDKVLFKNKIKDKKSRQIFNTPVVPSPNFAKSIFLILSCKLDGHLMLPCKERHMGQ